MPAFPYYCCGYNPGSAGYGKWGLPFVDNPRNIGLNVNAALAISSISVRTGADIDKIQVTLADGSRKLSLDGHGGGGGTESTFHLDEPTDTPGDYITQVELWSNTQPHGIRFRAKYKGLSPLYGQSTGTPYTITAPPNGRLIGFAGYAGNYNTWAIDGYPSRAWTLVPLWAVSSTDPCHDELPYMPHP